MKRPKRISYSITERGEVILPPVPFDGKLHLIHVKERGWVEGCWIKPHYYDSPIDGYGFQGFEWICANDSFSAQLEDVDYWTELPQIQPSSQKYAKDSWIMVALAAMVCFFLLVFRTGFPPVLSSIGFGISLLCFLYLSGAEGMFRR